MDDIQAVNPRRTLLSYQRKWVADDSRFKYWNKARQIGGSYACAFEVVEDCLYQKSDWVVLSASEDTAGEFLRLAQKAERMFIPALSYRIGRPFPEAKTTASDMNFYNGSRLLALPANPRTARSYSANVVLDEFAHHQHSELIWDAAYPIISNPLQTKLKLRVISSPNGINNLFYKLGHADNDFKKYRTTIYDAIAGGLEIDLEELKKNCITESAWKQNFECEFLDDSNFELVCPRSIVDFVLRNPPLKIGNTRIAFIDWGGTIAETAICILEGNEVIAIIAFIEPNEDAAVNRVVRILMEHKVKEGHAFSDEGGFGHTMNTFAAKSGFQINGVRNNDPCLSKNYANRGAEMWYDAKQMFKEQKIIMLNDEKTITQLTSRRVDFTAKGIMGLEKKESLASRNLPSPDRADALCGAISCAKYFIPDKNIKIFDTSEYEDQNILDEIALRGGAFAGL